MTQPLDPTYSPERKRYNALDPITAVVTAWTEPWPNEDWRALCKQEVLETMPALAWSLDRLAEMVFPLLDMTHKIEAGEGDWADGSSAEAILHRLQELPAVEVADEVIDEAPTPDVGSVSPETIEAIAVATNLKAVLTELKLGDEEELPGEFEIEGATIQEMGARALRATERMARWGLRAVYRDARQLESRLREKLVVRMYNYDEVTQNTIADMIGVSSYRVWQILRDYHDRMDYENGFISTPKRSKKKETVTP